MSAVSARGPFRREGLRDPLAALLRVRSHLV